MTTPLNPYPDNANWPGDWQGVRLRGKYMNASGQPSAGHLLFTQSPAAVVSKTTNTIILASTLKVTLDASGEFDVVLPATNDPDLNPTNFTYRVEEKIPGGRTYNIELPLTDGIVQLATRTPVAEMDGEAMLRGPAGNSAYEVAVSQGFTGTEVAWLASLRGPAGETGPRGAAGPTGATGPAGPQGAQGPQGTAGSNGAAGATGPAGPQGPAGPKGDTGLTGPVGPAGATGATGPKGADGTGVTIKGSRTAANQLPTTGNTVGDAYLVNGNLYVWNGTAWENTGSIQGPAGPTGPTGPTGPAGVAGPTGPAGAQGIQGPAGPTGPAGPKGDTGAAGAQGPQGATGATGAAGTNGTNGTNGRGYNFRGAFLPSTAYAVDDTVTFEGSTYRRLTAGTSGTSFTQSPNWELVAAAGRDGTNGTDGADGTGVPSVRAVKTASTGRASNTTITADPGLKFTAAANEVWDVDIFVVCQGTVAGDIKVAMLMPAGATFTGNMTGIAQGVTGTGTQTWVTAHQIASGVVYPYGTLGATIPSSVRISGTVKMGATAGEVALGWAQNSSDAVATEVLADSTLLAVKVA